MQSVLERVLLTVLGIYLHFPVAKSLGYDAKRVALVPHLLKVAKRQEPPTFLLVVFVL